MEPRGEPLPRGVRAFVLSASMGGIVDSLVSTLRPVPIKGKGFLLDFVTPREGMRTVTVTRSFAMTLNLANVIHRQIFMGCFARDMTRWARVLLRPGGIFLDVGAHIGYFSLHAADLVGQTGRVYAVEPNPASFASLQAHLAANHVSHVKADMIGLAERAGSMRLYAPDLAAQLDYNATLLARPGWQAIDIPTRRLDDCLDTWAVTRVDLMKIDVEGSEPRVLAGGARHLAQGVVRHLMIEINGPRLVEAGSSPASLVRRLGELGFLPATLTHGSAVPLPPDSFDLDPTHEKDCLLVHRAALS